MGTAGFMRSLRVLTPSLEIGNETFRRVGDYRARAEDFRGAVLVEELVVLVRDDATDHNQDVGTAEFFQFGD